MLKLISLLFCLYTFASFSDMYAQNEWNKIVYYSSNGENSPELKTYYIITVNSSGEGKLEYFKSGKVNEYEFQSGKKSLNKYKNLLVKSGVFKLEPQDLKSESLTGNRSLSNMTIYFEKTKENYLHYSGKEVSDEEIEEKRKEPFLAIPTEYNVKYSEMINKIYLGIEFLVPDKIWNEALN
jgi:hypothetical protein